MIRIQIHDKVKFTKDTATWIAPAIGIPALRYFQDRKEQRNELFVRDASTYSIGALGFIGLFFGGKALLRRYESTFNQWIAKKWNRPSLKLNSNKIELISYSVALVANILYAGIGAVRLSQLFSRIQQPISPKSAQPTFLVPIVPQRNAFQMNEGRIYYQDRVSPR